MSMGIDGIRARLREGEALPEDLTWARTRVRVLEEWPDDLTQEQEREQEWLRGLLNEAE